MFDKNLLINSDPQLNEDYLMSNTYNDYISKFESIFDTKPVIANPALGKLSFEDTNQLIELFHAISIAPSFQDLMIFFNKVSEFFSEPEIKNEETQLSVIIKSPYVIKDQFNQASYLKIEFKFNREMRTTDVNLIYARNAFPFNNEFVPF